MVIIFAGELLKKAEHLLIMGLHPSEIIKGYELACAKALSELESTRLEYLPLFFCQLFSHSIIYVQPPISFDTVHPRFRLEACHCIQTIWIRGYTIFFGGGGCPCRHAPQSQKFQRRQRACGQNNGRKLGWKQSGPGNGIWTRARGYVQRQSIIRVLSD